MDVSDEALAHARCIAAEIVTSFGRKYLPIYQALDDEMTRREQIAASLHAAAAQSRNARKQRLRGAWRKDRTGLSLCNKP